MLIELTLVFGLVEDGLGLLVVGAVEMSDFVVLDEGAFVVWAWLVGFDVTVEYFWVLAVVGAYETGLVSLVLWPVAELVVAEFDFVVLDLAVEMVNGDRVVLGPV